MKKLPQSAVAKAQNSRLRKQRRNYQVGGTKKRAVHPVNNADNPQSSPTGPGETVQKVQKIRKSRMIDLRVERMTRRLVASMTDCPGASFETHCDACGLGLSTFYEWMGRGEELPKSCYGKFRAAMVRAMAQGEKVLHKAAMRTHAIHLLARRFPNHYPSERQLMEIAGANGTPLIPTGQFNVVLELATPPGQPQEPEPVFRIIKPDGSADLWPPPEQSNNNGETPP
jgi:hypothetical protein